ncbi:MAG: LysR family transcriptional regulator [Pseudomonadota bacterium]
MSIRQFRALQAIGEHRSFARAADALNLTQSAISGQIATLEAALGATLFDRKRRPPALTRAGRIALRHAQAIVAEYDEMIDAVATVGADRGTFRLGAIPTVLTSLLPDGLIRLRAEHPGLVVSVVSGLSGDLLEMAASGEVDASLMHAPRALDTALEWREIARQRIVVLAPPGSTETDPAAVFAAHPYLRFNRRAWVAPLIEARLAALGIAPRTQTELQSIEAIYLMVGLGLGASILPDVGARAFAAEGLRILEFGSPPIHRSVGLVSRRDMIRRSARRVVGDAFEAAAGAL